MEENCRVVILMPNDDVSEGLNARPEKSRASVGAKTVQRFQDFSGRVLTNIDVNSGTSNLR